MLIEHILHRKGREVETISAAALVSDAAVLLHDRNIGALVVMADEDAEGGVAVAGILSERDVVRIVAQRCDPDAIRIGRLPVEAVASVDANASIEHAWTTMMEHDLVQVPVTEEGRLIGVLRRADLRGRLQAPRTVIPA